MLQKAGLREEQDLQNLSLLFSPANSLYLLLIL